MSPAEGRSFWFFCPALSILAARGFVVFRAAGGALPPTPGAERQGVGGGPGARPLVGGACGLRSGPP